MDDETYPESEGLVYFYGYTNRKIKIGHTRFPDMRIRTLRYSSGVWAQSFLATVDGGRDLERAYHERFAEHRHGKSEWFDPAPEILAEIERLES